MAEKLHRDQLGQFTTTLAARVRDCGTVQELCCMVGELCHELLPHDVIVVSLYDPDREVITVRDVHGLGTMLEQALRVLGTDPRKLAIRLEDMTADERRRYVSGRLEQVPDGLYELVTRRIPRPLCQAAQRVLGIEAIYCVGFAMEGVPQGGLMILSRSAPRPDAAPLVELMSGMVSLAIRQRQAEQDRALLERQLQQAQRLEAIGRLAGGVAHDYNNTLQNILVIAELMSAELPPEHPHQEHLADLLAAVAHARETTKSLLAIGRRQQMSLGTLDLAALLGELERALRRMLRDDVLLTCDRGDGPVVVRGDGDELRRVVINLAINAQDAMPSGGTLRLALRAEPETRQAILEVADSGCGMEPEVLRRAFDPFFTTKPIDQGTGLGLATVYGIVEQHGGQISLDSSPGRGTSATITLPLAQAEEVAGEEKARSAAMARLAPGGWILLVDDEPMVRRVIERVLKRGGWEVVTASNGDEALARCQARETAPRLLISDVTMPGMTGWELLRALRDRHPGLPAVLMSGYAAAAEEHAADEPGLRLLDKPMSVQALEEALAQVCSAAPGERTESSSYKPSSSESSAARSSPERSKP